MEEGRIGERIYLVRLAMGDGLRKPLPMERFAAILNERPEAKKKYSSGKLSLLETNKQRADLDDIAVIAAVDPLKRGKAWLAGWTDEPAERVAREAPLDAFTPVPRPEEARSGPRRASGGGAA